MEEPQRNVSIIKGGSVCIETLVGNSPPDIKLTMRDFTLLSEDGLPINEYEFALGIAHHITQYALNNRTELEGRLMPLLQDESRLPS
jgi:hypothetical protein